MMFRMVIKVRELAVQRDLQQPRRMLSLPSPNRECFSVSSSLLCSAPMVSESPKLVRPSGVSIVVKCR
jgi:hypothetical protein